MSIKRDLRDLLSQPGPGTAPDADPWLARQIFDAWLAQKKAEDGEHVRSSTAPFWASDGATCARKLSYSMLERAGLASKSDPPGLADEWRFHLGNVVHDAIQTALPESEHEVRAILLDPEDGSELVSCRADSLVPLPGAVGEDGEIVEGLAALEIKSMNGFGFKSSATTFKGPAEGPRWSAVVQLALTCRALVEGDHPEITHGMIILASLENVSPNLAKDFVDSEVARFAAQFTYTIDELLDIADVAVARLRNVKRVVTEGTLAPRAIYDPVIPRAARIVNPATGLWNLHDREGNLQQSGSTWMCGYCDWQSQCQADGA